MLNLLVAYPYAKPDVIELIRQNEGRIRFLLDSGAFTAWKAGKPIALDDYCRFLESLPIKPWRYFALDVIGDPHGTMKNYEMMLKRGFKPVPIFTRGEDPSVLEDYYKTSDVVGIGGLVGTQGNKGFVKGIMKLVNGRRVHWLGFSALAFVKHYRPYMLDCATWNTGASYAEPVVYMGGGKIARFKLSAVKEKGISAEMDAGYHLHLETNGSVDLGCLSTYFDHITLSPKQPLAETKLKWAHDVKVLYPHIHSGVTLEDFQKFPAKNRYLQPVHSDKYEQNLQATIQKLYENHDWRLSLQTHKITGVE